jgi:branched-chain amino acid transport system substrate-binding protein
MLRRRIVFAGLLLSTVGLLLTTGCRRNSNAGKEIHIAVVSALTGAYAEPGLDMSKGAEMAFDEINQAGGINGYRVVVDLYDDAGNPKEAPTVAARIAGSKNTVAVVGHLNSGTTMAAVELYANSGLALVMPVPTNPKITERGFNNLFRIPITDDSQGKAVARFAFEQLHVSSLAVVHDTDAWGEGIASVVRSRAAELGMSVPVYDSVPPEQRDFVPLLLKIKKLKTSAVFFAGGHAQAGVFFKQAAENGVPGQFLMGDSCFSPELIAIAGANTLDGRAYVSYIAPPWEDNPKAKKFVDDFTRKNGPIKGFAPLGYDAAQVLIAGLRQVNMAAPAAEIRKQLITVMHRPDFKVDGLIGQIKFRENGDNALDNTFFYRVVNGQFSVVQTDSAQMKAAP